jgi:hypothetical protein
MDRIQRMLTGMGGGQGGPPGDTPQVDTAEQIYISSLALLKMLKHGELAGRSHIGLLQMPCCPHCRHSVVCMHRTDPGWVSSNSTGRSMQRSNAQFRHGPTQDY